MSTRWEQATDAQDRTVHRLIDDHNGYMRPSTFREVLEVAGRYAVLDHDERVVESVHDTLDAAKNAAENRYDDAAEAHFVWSANNY